MSNENGGLVGKIVADDCGLIGEAYAYFDRPMYLVIDVDGFRTGRQARIVRAATLEEERDYWRFRALHAEGKG